MRCLTTPDDSEDARRQISALLDGRGEWFCAKGAVGHAAASPSSASVTLRRGEWELRAGERGELFFSLLGERGREVWRVVEWEWTGRLLSLVAARQTGGARARLELIPRASADEARAAVSAARRAAAERVASRLSQQLGASAERVGLSAGARRGEPGRFARIVLRGRGRERIAVTGPIVDLDRHEVDNFLSSALVWFARLDEKNASSQPLKLCLVAAPRLAAAIAERTALLGDAVRRALLLYQFDEADDALTPVRLPGLDQLLGGASRLPRHHDRLVTRAATSETARRIIMLMPEAISAVRAGHGETLCFRGLAFARVRRLLNHERLWFGAPGARPRYALDETNWPQLLKLIDDLAEHRHAAPPDTRHAFYRAAPEAWLESLLRRDITRLDPGLILSPLHAQFRTPREAHAGARPVDLLALRRDGRLVVIELKAAEDAALVLQGADYWRRISTDHRAGHIRRAGLFAGAVISDQLPLVYLVAPLLRFHRSCEVLARCLAPEIEMYRLDLNEDWRAGVRVARRLRIN